MARKVTTVPVSMRALIQRINRKLAGDRQQLKAARGERGRSDLGDHYVIDLDRNAVVALDVDPEAWGRKTGALQPWEKLVSSQ